MCVTWGLGRTQGGEEAEAEEGEKNIEINKEVGGCPDPPTSDGRGKRSSRGVTKQ